MCKLVAIKMKLIEIIGQSFIIKKFLAPSPPAVEEIFFITAIC